MGKINAEWHAKHVMPKNPTTRQRIEWHIEHAEHCACRPIPAKLQEEIDRYHKDGKAVKPKK